MQREDATMVVKTFLVLLSPDKFIRRNTTRSSLASRRRSPKSERWNQLLDPGLGARGAPINLRFGKRNGAEFDLRHRAELQNWRASRCRRCQVAKVNRYLDDIFSFL